MATPAAFENLFIFTGVESRRTKDRAHGTLWRQTAAGGVPDYENAPARLGGTEGRDSAGQNQA